MISIRNLSYIYRSEKEEVLALDNINLDIPKGGWLAVIGPNGSGKSTLARHLNALLTPVSGTVYVENMDTKDPELLWKIRQKVAFVFQNPDNQLIATTVEEDVAFGPENMGLPPEDIIRRVDLALHSVGMDEYREFAPHLLSGGQKQRVAIAGALAMEPDYLVMDEATAMLDPQGRMEVLETLSRLNKEFGLTIIYITHFMEEAALAHRITVIDQGRIKITGSPQEVFSQTEKLMKMGLDVPDAVLLAKRLKSKGWSLNRVIITADELVEELCRLK